MEFKTGKKHAYLIMAHNSPRVLMVLLSALDDERNDIFLHIDLKSKEIDVTLIRETICRAHLYLVKSMECRWGEFSLVECELRLIKTCLKKKERYSRIHLLSGSDLPIKSQNEIYSFFEKYKSEEFINIEDIDAKEDKERISWFIPDKSKNERIYRECCKINNILINRLHRPRNDSLLPVKTSQWFSITYDCAKYLWRKRHWIKRHFHSTDCPDEMFLGMTLYGSRYWNNLSTIYKYKDGNMSNMRLIDWKRGKNNSPYTFTSEDYEMIKKSPMLFARKFSDEHFDIVEKIQSMLTGEKQDEIYYNNSDI